MTESLILRVQKGTMFSSNIQCKNRRHYLRLLDRFTRQGWTQAEILIKPDKKEEESFPF